jgi:formylglycine-generating enzyme required for sulfatase activity
MNNEGVFFMRNKTTARFAQWLGFIVVMTVTGLSFAACDNGPDKGVAPTITTESLPGGTVNTAYSQTLAATGDTPVTWSLAGGTLPAGLDLAANGAITGTPTAANTFGFTVKATNAAGTDTKSLSITIDTAAGGTAPKISTTTLQSGTVGTAYNQKLAATGGTSITWSIDSGTLPTGLTLAETTGAITGTPTTAGTFTFTVNAANAAGDDTKELSITIATPVAPTINTATLPDGTVGTPYTQTLAATGTAPFTWSLDSGTLPTGLTLGATGTITGTPTAAGTSNFTVKAANTAGSDTKQLSITIDGQKPEIEGMVWIQGGTFTMGSPANEPGHWDQEIQHSVTLTGFYMGKYPVTQAQYQAIMGSNPSDFTTSSGGDNPANRPVEKVSWYDAIVFCNKLSMEKDLSPAYSINGSTDPTAWGPVPTSNDATWDAVTVVAGSNGYRLPTEAQWEYACRAGTTAAFNWGTDTVSSTQANFYGSYVDVNNPVAGTYLNRTTAVGNYASNQWGLYDMHGNVQEWCWDWFGDYASVAQENPNGAVSGNGRVIRGGSWNSDGRSVRSANRDFNAGRSFRLNIIGFRVVRP